MLLLMTPGTVDADVVSLAQSAAIPVLNPSSPSLLAR
jgi:hypothetical protein